MQLFLTSSHFLWFYDYFLTLGDEVRHSSDRLFLSDGLTDKVCLAWKEVLE